MARLLCEQVHEAGQPGGGIEARHSMHVPTAQLLEQGGLRQVVQQVQGEGAPQGAASLEPALKTGQGTPEGRQRARRP